MRSEWRVACVRIPRFPIGAVWQAQLPLELPLGLPPSESAPGRGGAAKRGSAQAPTSSDPLHWDERPIALVDGKRIRVVSAAAGRARVRAGMSVPEALARCAKLDVVDWDPVALEAEITRLTAALLVASPQVTPVAGAPGMWWVGAGGFDSLGGERGLVRALLRVARLWHPYPRVAVADSCVAARAATWGAGASLKRRSADTQELDGTTVVAPGGCAAFLAPAPLGLIPLDEEFREALVSLGVRTAGALAALDPGDVERRWGAAGLSGWRLAHGEDPRRPVLARAEARRTVHAELAMSVTTMEPILFLARSALDRLVRELVADGRAAATLSLTLTLDDGRGVLPSGGPAHTITREVRTAHPLARVAPLFERCRAVLDKWTLDAPVCALTVSVIATAPLSGEQGDLMRTAWRDPAAIDAALERLRAELGPQVVVKPVAGDEHRFEKQGEWGCGDVEDGISPHPHISTSPHPALRLLESPEPIAIERDSSGVPVAMWWRGGRISIARADGPDRLSGEWWKGGYARDYWRCEAERDAEFLLFLDRGHVHAGANGHASGAASASSDAWYLHGWYD